MSAEFYRDNLETLKANEDLTGQLIEGMDTVLREGGHRFGGRLNPGEWFPMGGESSPVLEDFSFRTAAGLVGEVDRIQKIHDVYSGKPSHGIKYYSHLDISLAKPNNDPDDTSFVRRFNVWGMDTWAGNHDAAHYRFDWKEDGPDTLKNSLVVARLGHTVVTAELWTMTDQDAFAKQCFDTFASTQVVNDVLRGDFQDEADLDQKLAALIVDPEHHELYAELRNRALAQREGNELATNHNFLMPDRDQLTGALQRLNEAFSA
jgi:hypothetical protein